MKNNKLIVFIILISLFISGLPLTQNSFAAYTYMWTVDGEQISIGGSNTAGTASWQKDNGADNGGILTLNNYNGGQIKIDCYGTGLGHIFDINLVGDNYITVDKGIGVLALEPITFSGDGTLTIEAAIPISGNDYIIKDGAGTKIEGNYTFSENQKVIIKANTTITNLSNNDDSSIVDADDEESELLSENIEDVDTDTETNGVMDKESAINWELIAIIMVTVTATNIIVVIVLLILLAKKNKAQTANSDKNISNVNTNI